MDFSESPPQKEPGKSSFCQNVETIGLAYSRPQLARVSLDAIYVVSTKFCEDFILSLRYEHTFKHKLLSSAPLNYPLH